MIRIFPNRKSAVRMMGALLLEQDEQWSTGHRYVDMLAYWQWREASTQLSPHLQVQASETKP